MLSEIQTMIAEYKKKQTYDNLLSNMAQQADQDSDENPCDPRSNKDPYVQGASHVRRRSALKQTADWTIGSGLQAQ